MSKLVARINKNFLLLICSLVLFIGLASAAPTPAGTTIEPTLLTLKYAGNTLNSTTTGNTIQVMAIYGFEIAPTFDRTVTASGVTSVNFSHQIINKANTTDNIIVSINYITNNWNYRYVFDDNNDGIRQTSENTIMSVPTSISAGTTINFFLELTPNIITTLFSGITVSTNQTNVVQYTGFNGVGYGGIGLQSVSDNIISLGSITPSITVISPTEDAQIVMPYSDIIIDVDSTAFNIDQNSIDIWVADELAITSGSFTTKYTGANSAFVPSNNGYRIILDKVSLLPQNTTVSVTINVADVFNNTATYNYSFATTISSYVRIQLESLLQGYYDPQTDLMITTSITLEFRTTRDIAAAVSYNIQLDSSGQSAMMDFSEITAGNYYVYLEHKNHINIVTVDKITFAESLTVVNTYDSASVYFRDIYLSGNAQNVTQNLRTETNGKLTIRGGDYNNDNTINIVDWSSFDYEWKNGGALADFDGNGLIDTRDYGIWLSNNQDYLPLD